MASSESPLLLCSRCLLPLQSCSVTSLMFLKLSNAGQAFHTVQTDQTSGLSGGKGLSGAILLLLQPHRIMKAKHSQQAAKLEALKGVQ